MAHAQLKKIEKSDWRNICYVLCRQRTARQHHLVVTEEERDAIRDSPAPVHHEDALAVVAHARDGAAVARHVRREVNVIPSSPATTLAPSDEAHVPDGQHVLPQGAVKTHIRQIWVISSYRGQQLLVVDALKRVTLRRPDIPLSIMPRKREALLVILPDARLYVSDAALQLFEASTRHRGDSSHLVESPHQLRRVCTRH